MWNKFAFSFFSTCCFGVCCCCSSKIRQNHRVQQKWREKKQQNNKSSPFRLNYWKGSPCVRSQLAGKRDFFPWRLNWVGVRVNWPKRFILYMPNCVLFWMFLFEKKNGYWWLFRLIWYFIIISVWFKTILSWFTAAVLNLFLEKYTLM